MGNGVANPLEFAREREVVKGQHVLDHGTYVSDPGFKASTYPKWLYKDGKKPKLAETETHEITLLDDGYSDEAPKQKVAPEDN